MSLTLEGHLDAIHGAGLGLNSRPADFYGPGAFNPGRVGFTRLQHHTGADGDLLHRGSSGSHADNGHP